MTVRLVNSAIMPAAGTYRVRKINLKEFCEVLRTAWENRELVSYLGYQRNIFLISKWIGIDVPFSRKETVVKDGDKLLIMKLKYRIKDPGEKKHTEIQDEDFEFFLAEYSGKGVSDPK